MPQYLTIISSDTISETERRMHTTVHILLAKFQILQILNFFTSFYFTVFLHCESTKTWQGFFDIKVSRCLDRKLNIITKTKPAKILQTNLLPSPPHPSPLLSLIKALSQQGIFPTCLHLPGINSRFSLVRKQLLNEVFYWRIRLLLMDDSYPAQAVCPLLSSLSGNTSC